MRKSVFMAAFCCILWVMVAFVSVEAIADTSSLDTPTKRQAGEPELTPKCTQISHENMEAAKTILASSVEPFLIQEIRLIQLPIFDHNKATENRTIHQLANRFHRATRPSVITKQLRIKEGDVYQKANIAAAERQLRANPYLTKVSIQPFQICQHPEGGGTLSLSVEAREVWSIIPSAAYTNIDDESTVSVAVTDVNLLGSGQWLSLGYTKREDRDSVRGSFFSPYLINHAIDFFASASVGDEFSARRFSLAQPFRNIHSTTAFGVEFRDAEFELNRYLRTGAIYIADTSTQYANLFWGTASGFTERWIRRLQWGITFDHRSFDNQRTIPEVNTISDRKRDYPWFSITQFTQAFKKIQNLRQMHRVEDLFLGYMWRIKMGYAVDPGDSETDYLLTEASVRGTAYHSEHHLLQWRLSLSNSWLTQMNQRENFLLNTRIQYYWLHNRKQRSVLLAQRAMGRSLTIDQLLTQGGNRGLRGYPRFYQLGNEQFSLNLEHRYYFDRELWRLLQFAAVIYADAGRAWFKEPTLSTNEYTGDELLWNLGFGLRIASNRTGLGSILHIDLAFPMTDAPVLADNQVGEAFDNSRFTIELKSTF